MSSGPSPGAEFVEMEHNRQQSLCCGSVLTLIGEPPVAHQIGDHRLQEAIDIEADAVLAACPCCQFQLRVSADRTEAKIPVYDLAWFAAKGLGIEDISETTHYALTQWAVFERMVYLMTPCGFADLMADMFPELMAAMPLGMGKMMGFFGKVGNGIAIDAMKPLFPVLFPILLPGMMPKVMDKMLALIEQRIPIMPDYMKEQLPDLMPPTMDNLMPKMLPELIPAVTPLMVDYLKGKDISTARKALRGRRRAVGSQLQGLVRRKEKASGRTSALIKRVRPSLDARRFPGNLRAFLFCLSGAHIGDLTMTFVTIHHDVNHYSGSLCRL